jgi:hypothetical protein
MDDDDVVLDAAGNRVLIGLSQEETIEFELLGESIAAEGPLPHISRDAPTMVRISRLVRSNILPT